MLNSISLLLRSEISLIQHQFDLILTDALDSCHVSDNSTSQSHCNRSPFPGHVDRLTNIAIRLPPEPSTFAFQSDLFPVTLAKTTHASDCSSGPTNYFDSDPFGVKWLFP